MGFGGFSWKRAIGITRVKSKISRGIGIPLTKSGRQRKIGKAVTGGCCGCIVPLFGIVFSVFLLIAIELVFLLY